MKYFFGKSFKVLYAFIFCTVFLLNAKAETVRPLRSANNIGVWAFSVTTPSGKQNILMGSMHVAAEALRQPDANIVRNATIVVFEHPPGAHGDSKPTSSWRRGLSRDDISRLRKNLRCQDPAEDDEKVDADLEVILEQSTPLAANQLAFARCESKNYLSRDDLIMLATMHFRKKMGWLETDEDVGAIERRVPWDETGRGVHFALSDEARLLQSEAVDAINAGDYPRLERVVDTSIAKSGISVKLFKSNLVERRNENWMATMPVFLEKGGAFILVGAEHLPGEHGLVDLLRKRGYKLTPIQVPSSNATIEAVRNNLS